MPQSLETPLFFPGADTPLFGVLHEPAADPAATPFVFCHAFGEEKLWAHRVFVAFARELARRGHPVLRFDCGGNGDSGGDFSQSSLNTNLADIGAAIALLKAKRGSETVALLGLRFGATEAALVAEQRDDVSALVLWNPISHGGRYMQELLRINLSTQLAVHGGVTRDREALVEQLRNGQLVNVDGYEAAWPLYEQVSAVDLGAGPRPFNGRCLIVQTERNPAAQPGKDLLRLQQQYRSADFRLVQEEPFWKEIPRFYEVAGQLFAVTLSWLEER
jgi:uncharacterized protein